MNEDIKARLVKAYNQDAVRRKGKEPPLWKLELRRRFIDQIESEEKRELLEIGAGAGQDSRFFADQGLSVQAIDMSDEMVRICLEQGLKAQVMDFYTLDFPDRSFDAVYAFNCLLHVPKAEMVNVLKEIRRVLREDGLFLMVVYGGKDFEGIWDEDWCEPPRFFSFYTEPALREVVKDVFELVEAQKVPLEDSEYDSYALTLRKAKASDPKRCPLCHGNNECELEAGGSINDCWCITTTVAQELRDRVPADKAGRACICRHCAESSSLGELHSN